MVLTSYGARGFMGSAFEAPIPWGSLVIAVVAGICAWQLTRSLIRRHPTRHWKQTAGLVRDVRVDGDDREGYTVCCTYRYHVAGEDYLMARADAPEGPFRERAWAERAAARLRDKPALPVFFDPLNPADSRIEPVETGAAWFGLVLAVAAVVAALYHLQQWWL
ncbi:MAG TPA: DUF3592 domain-containing protein [Gemmatimonadales bacterium]|nr:DUF3592 domain-containing protein [Gemmatimonadales bacterium]